MVGFGIRGLLAIGVQWDVTSTISQLVYRLLIYCLMVALFALVVWYRSRKVGLSDISLTRLPSWGDIGLGAAGLVLYFLLASIALAVAAKWFEVNTSQAQDLGFTHLGGNEQLVAFIVLVVLTPFFEEVLFRGFLYGRLRQVRAPWWVPAVVVSVLFGLAHWQWNVGIDVFCLSMVACALREVTGSIWAGILLHMAKNMLAYLVMFVFVTGVGG